MTLTTREDIIGTFDAFRQELDDHNDRRERLVKVRRCCARSLMSCSSFVKLSREVTNLSKKVIFLLHRLASEELRDETEAVSAAVKQSHKKLAEIKSLFEQMHVELEGENFWRYQKTVSGGVQEYIEALSFSYYLEHKSLLSFQDVQEDMKSSEGLPVC